ncbi:GNAT family N-acetyltransferase [Streptomyces sp. NPDC003456]|uniref:GNAT family N-acetyltransferase n=1 Tax=Streptomyces sp. NPDC003456 TaxID=3364683 RepID=UPI003681F57D
MNVAAELPAAVSAGRAQVTTPAPREIWWDLAERDADLSVTQTPAWLDCLCATGPHRDASRLYAFPGGGLVVLPLVSRGRRPRRLDAEESWPAGWGIGGPLASAGVGPDQARVVFQDLARRPALRVAVRLRPQGAELWAGAAGGAFRLEPHTTQAIDLDGGFGTVWRDRFHQRVRRDVKRAEKAHVDVEVDRSGRLVPVFQELYDRSIDRWAVQQHEPRTLARWRRRLEFPPERLAAVAARFGASCSLWAAWNRGEPAAALVVLRHGPHAKFWRAAMDREVAHPVRATPLLYRLAIEDACEQGCRTFDLGESAPGSSLEHFKAGFGAVSRPSPRYWRETLPVSAAERSLRTAVKRAIRFQDA